MVDRLQDVTKKSKEFTDLHYEIEKQEKKLEIETIVTAEEITEGHNLYNTQQNLDIIPTNLPPSAIKYLSSSSIEVPSIWVEDWICKRGLCKSYCSSKILIPTIITLFFSYFIVIICVILTNYNYNNNSSLLDCSYESLFVTSGLYSSQLDYNLLIKPLNYKNNQDIISDTLIATNINNQQIQLESGWKFVNYAINPLVINNTNIDYRYIPFLSESSYNSNAIYITINTQIDGSGIYLLYNSLGDSSSSGSILSRPIDNRYNVSLKFSNQIISICSIQLIYPKS